VNDLSENIEVNLREYLYAVSGSLNKEDNPALEGLVQNQVRDAFDALEGDRAKLALSSYLRETAPSIDLGFLGELRGVVVEFGVEGGTDVFGKETTSNFNGTNIPAPDANLYRGTHYPSPFTTVPENFECTQFYEVYITSGNETGTDADLTLQIEGNLNRAAATSFESMVGFMANEDVLPLTDGDQSLKTWFIHVDGNTSGTNVTPARWARAAGTDSDFMTLTDDADALVNIQRTLRNAFIHATPTSATLVSSSIPTNVFNRAKSLDSFFVALFEPGSSENWPGNIKKFQLTDSNNSDSFNSIVDVNGRSAFDTSDGKIANNALSFWTLGADLPAPNPETSEIAGLDGRAVKRGGAGQKMPGFLNDDVGMNNAPSVRQVYVEASAGTQLDDFNANTTTASALQTLLGAASVQDAMDLIAWARGIDVDNEDNDNSVTDTRPWLLGGVLHSRPLPINYGAVNGYSQDNPNIRIFYGSNDGFFHIIENTTTGGDESGKEVFSFIPRELLGNLSILRNNNGSHRLPYGMDGEPVALVTDNNHDGNINNSDSVYIYTGMRRGGKSYYAFDASNPAATPTLQWKITKTTNGDFDELGLTFSTPTVAKVRFENTARDVLIFAGGFDINKDDSAGSIARGPDSEGNAIYIVDAITGDLIWKVTGSGANGSTNNVLYEAALTHSIPSAISTLDSNSNGIVDRLYVGDTGSVLWRIDLPEGNTPNHRQDNWSITKMANFWSPSGSQDRRFFHAPDIVQTKDAQGNYDGILIQSGDRANPTETRDTNYVFYVKDRNIVSGIPPQPLPPSTAADGIFNITDLADATNCISAACTMLNYHNGWKIELTERGQKGLSSPVIVNGKVFYTTYTPAIRTNSCSAPEGGGQLNIVDLKDGTASFNNSRSYDLGPGIPPSVTTIGYDTVIIPSKGIVDPFALVANPTNTPVKPLQVGGDNLFITSWRELGVDFL
jgi:type IV pilus assembly protein PilY1